MDLKIGIGGIGQADKEARQNNTNQREYGFIGDSRFRND